MSSTTPFPAERTVVLTGAASARGIGRAAADRMASEGWSIAILDINAEDAKAATEWMIAAGPNDRAAGSSPYLRLMAYALGAHYLAKGALAAEGADAATRRTLAEFFATQIAPQTSGLAEAATQGAEVLYALDAETLTA